MPWGWECRAKLVKQLPAKPTERRGKVSGEDPTPSPQDYEPPQIFCGKGFGKIKRAPAYTFGHLTPVSLTKPVAKPFAPIFNIRGMAHRGGTYKVKHGVVSPQLDPPCDRTPKPGPAAYAPTLAVRYKRNPAYSCRPPARPPYQPWDMWTPPANMYCPPIPGKNAPAYSLGYTARTLTSAYMPGPGEHEPNFNYTKKRKPAFTFGYAFKRIIPAKVPPPNHYCEKKFMATKRTVPAISFGIRHSPYLGEKEVYLKSSKLDLIASDDL